MIKKTLTIAGSDAGGGAGIQADLKTFQEFGTFGISTITSILTVDPASKKHHIFSIPDDVVAQQLQTAFSGGSLDAVKIGLLGSFEMIELIETQLKKEKQRNIVVDPVMAVKSRKKLLHPEMLKEMVERLFPMASVVTPNLTEAAILAQIPTIDTIEDMKQAAINIKQLGPEYVVIKGGSRIPGDKAVDLLYDGNDFHFFKEEKIETLTNHGAGCAFAGAITANLAKGVEITETIQLSKDYITAAIKNGIFLNPYTGYIWHGALRQSVKL
ncbi:bifunctional hydroxymethylpyrimidine kinase/phosphomethylpyrimidine kinase [Vagococcus elongatus]|uniref:pyridoxal kinase n=1 Tax=Vagococcus elongatus TaxID=180344 RepID=A0A430ARS1_9ENTE|nr:bifunctional hydroxymethylpyrimidine kinase/phosphomethylpyrimidine kinase [Vagococcus elongatus]RSU10759.1 bifunctional hydroxymethylpyrimidine kinase/phosphomethylpyrimidine kinase [Vagococcus elongatus]